MSTLSFQQIEALIAARGGNAQQQQIGAAIVEAESGGRTDAQGDVNLGQGIGQYVGSEGIWQIFGQAHPTVSSACAEDPNCASDAARLISNNWTNWNAWSTFKSGAYRQFLSGAPGGGSGGDPTLLSSGPGDALIQWIESQFGIPGLQSVLPNLQDLFWKIGLIVLGLALVVIGLTIFFAPTTATALKIGTSVALRRAGGPS